MSERLTEAELEAMRAASAAPLECTCGRLAAMLDAFATLRSALGKHMHKSNGHTGEW